MTEQDLKERIKESVEVYGGTRDIKIKFPFFAVEIKELIFTEMSAAMTSGVMLGLELGFDAARELFDANCSSMEWPYKYETFDDLKKELEPK